ncbi:MAG: 50S ribosomal protein L11 methyltransferase [Gemmatimonadota bacterium]|jgi:ribosomal protein L11 methyltransferase|nr:50S ribosomal protein L11 methyltransferase [Gemmatimonadota bacterium]
MPPPERWFVLSVTAPETESVRDLIAEGLVALGGQSVLDEGHTLSTFLSPPSDPDAFAEHATSVLREWTNGDISTVSWSWRQNEDWEREWRRGLQPRKISPRFVVKPSWASWDAAPGEIIVEIDPQMAFGTGEHATTRGCLRLLDSCFVAGDRALDVGSGSAILSIAAAMLGASEVVAVEFDPDANINARENIERGGVEAIVSLREQMADPALISELGQFDVILANILSGVVRPLLPAFEEALRPDGRLIVSGILRTEADDVVRDATAAGLRLLKEDQEDEWWSALFVR